MAAERFVLQVYVGTFSNLYEALSIEASKQTTAEEIVECISDKLGLKDSNLYELVEVVGNEGGQDCLERPVGNKEHPVGLQLLWPRKLEAGPSKENYGGPEYRFSLRRKHSTNWYSFSWTHNDSQLLKDYFLRFLYQPRDREYPDLCQLPDLTEQMLLENLKARFDKGHIYTYVGSILIAVNPFKFYPIYNPKYVQLYQNRRLGDLPPHIFAIADAAYQAMLRRRLNQCIVISGESGSGKTESTNLLLHHLTALSQKGSHGCGVEQTILGAGPVLEAFGNAKTKHNNNSSRFGKFIQVNYKENGMVHGAIVQKYLLEKSRIVSQAKNERNYHVFYYLLAGCTPAEKEALSLTKPSEYFYLNQSKCYTLDGVDEAYELSRLKQSLEMVGFSAEKQRRVLSILAAVLHLGNVEFSKKSTYHNDEAVIVKNASVVSIISKLLMVREENLLSALTCKRTKAAKGETIIINYKMADAVATRDAMSKCLYGALFEWIVMQVNQDLLSKQDIREHKGNYIGVLDIFGFEDFGDQNYFEQFCINFANEHLHYYFNQHVFKYEQEEYTREGINWKNIDFHDNVACLQLIEGRPHGLLCLLDDQCNFPGASNETVLQKFVNHHSSSPLFEVPPCRQSAFVIKHYAGKVKYQIRDFREKNMDLMRPDLVCLLKGSSSAFVRELVGTDPLAIFRWQILKAFFKAYFMFSKSRELSRQRRESKSAITPKNNNISMLTKRLGLDGAKSKENIAVPSPFGDALGSRNACLNAKSSCLNCAHCVRGSLTRVASSPCPMHGLGSALLSNEAKVLQRANRILQKNKVNRTPSLKSQGVEKSVKNLQTLKTVVGRTNFGQGLQRTGRKQMQTVTFQFQQSLNQLMDTLNQANPFFVRCIKSNADKTPNHFDDMLVLVQLRYTGMLETVRIRQSGYSVRLSFDEFIQHYRILLSKGLLSSQTDIKDFLLRMNLNPDNYQMGKSKIFMRESEKLILDNMLHQEILQRIVTLQRWVRTWITRRRFLQMKNAAVCIQSHARRWMAQQRLSQLKEFFSCEKAAVTIQKSWKSFRERSTFLRLRQATINFQAHARGFLKRREFRKASTATPVSDPKPMQTIPPNVFFNGDSQSSNTDEAFLSKGSSQEELEIDKTTVVVKADVGARQRSKDSEDSSGVHEDSEGELLNPDARAALVPSAGTPSSPPPLPPRRSSQTPAPTGLEGQEVFDDEEKPRLDRRRNRPLRKLSLKRSKSNSKEALSPDIGPATPEASKGKIPLREMASEPMPMSPTHISSDDVLQSQHKGAFQKAKKHFRTLIAGGKSERKSTKDGDENERSESSTNPLISSQKLSFQSDSSFPSPCLSPVDRSLPSSPTKPLSSRHHIQSLNGFPKSSFCAVCDKTAHGSGFRCADCGLLFHAKCVNNLTDVPCTSRLDLSYYGTGLNQPSRPPRNKMRKGSKQNIAMAQKYQRSASEGGASSMAQNGSWNVTRTAEFTDPKDVLITDVRELHYMETFITKKIHGMEEGGKRSSSKESMVDIVFKEALKEFKSNLISTYSVAMPENMHISYKNLIDHFEQVMSSVCEKEKTFKTFPVIMGVNAFRGFLDEFRNLCTKFNIDEKSSNKKGGGHKRKRAKLKKALKEEGMEHCGHLFKPVQANIPTVCEICSSLMWLMEKVWVCQSCKLTCHKKCTAKVTVTCRDNSRSNPSKDKKMGQFGTPLSRLVSEEQRVPQLIEDLITVIELKGLYTEGIYRKSGTTSKIAELKAILDREDENVDLDEYSVHVLTAALKAFFREMPEPLMSFDLYDDFLWATAISDPQERLQAIYSHIAKLPRANFDLLERLLFHLARVAQQESANRMNANSLAIVFAPCILRTDRPMQMQDKLSDISKQTLCLQSIIADRLKQICETLGDIEILESAFKAASSRLSDIRQSKLHLNCDAAPSNNAVEEDPEEEEILQQQMETLRFEKVHLTSMLPSFRLANAGSEEDLAAAGAESTVGGSIEEPGTSGHEKPFKLSDIKLIEYPAASRAQNLRHLTKHRVGLPNRRLPSRFLSDDPPSLSKPAANGNGSEAHQPSSETFEKSVKVKERLFHPDDKPVTV